jgi:tetratricopeptide (TPR) repeat protein
MTPEQWQKIEELFAQAIELAPAAQERFLANLDPPTAAELRQLLQSDALPSEAIADAIGAVATTSARANQPGPTWSGRRIGAYTIDREIGRGGMGAVFEAHRADDQFQKRVALKVALRAPFSESFRSRFHHERQILAGLEHPNIARLLDGGETEEGLPFFAMEFVEGIPIHRYCEEHKLSVRDRLQLFLAVCDAAEYAHQSLIVHRDIKPANVLVSNTGIPKLLDFGIAKLLDEAEAQGGQTQTGLAPVTPDYCSPEQLRNQKITTRTDVYLLGLLLYELLTGERAQQADTSSPMALEQSICEREPPIASTRARDRNDIALSRILEGDLDTIIATATRKEPDQRFPNVSAFVRDIKLYLEGRPITSRPAGTLYRIAKYIRRNRLAVAAAAAFVIVLGGGIASTLYQAQRAARRFDQVRGIAKSLMFDVHDAIGSLPGSVPAQRIVVETALRYLDALASEASGDPKLLSEIAGGYVRIGGIQGADLIASEGNRTAAMESFQKAEKLLIPILKTESGDDEMAGALADARSSEAELLSRIGKSAEARKLLEEADRVLTPLAASSSAGIKTRRGLALIRMSLARDFGDGPDGIQLAERLDDSMRLLLELNEQFHADITREVAVSSSIAGSAYLVAKRIDRAIPLFSRTVDMLETELKKYPHDTNLHRSLMLARAKLADAYSQPSPLRDSAKALENYSRMFEQGRWMFESEPSKKSNRIDFAMSSIRYADAFPSGDARGLPVLEEGVQILADVIKADPNDTVSRQRWAEGMTRIGARRLEAQDWNGARSALDQAVKTGDELVRIDPQRPANRSMRLRAYMELGRFYQRRGDRAGYEQVLRQIDSEKAPQLADRIQKWKLDMAKLQR